MDTEHPDLTESLCAQVREAAAGRYALRIIGGDTKRGLGRTVAGAPLSLAGHRGVVSFEPSELVVTARAGTPLAELEARLDQAGQMLPYEPLLTGPACTLGGAVATGLSGPRRPWAGALRDFVLGVRMIDAKGQALRFGGEVMKNVAGYDLSRLMTGSHGCLGVITEVSLKVLPKPRARLSLRFELGWEEAARRLAKWRAQPLPLAGACHDGKALRLRLEGGEAAVAATHARLGGERFDDQWWQRLRRFELELFDDPRPLWRLSLPPGTARLPIEGEALLDWGGAQHWLKSDAPATRIHAEARRCGGHACCFDGAQVELPFTPLDAVMLRYHQRLKAQLDPLGIFNPGRLYPEL
ncbi:glycolate oxidase subunit GlcE [Halotalea alkalilenta]|uniref:Glycolate oxidase subunit GlcE n=1 Tax=Halotalea alkalilenta TaxID=376489 RepID=A0A172YCE7_9GAMM|nr:glycolate oxidase subunit GlcE [Halotalea alkalilenta]ANF56898.1 glycolate oxidase subunit GlcE [Halotalea alkalilenta]